MIGTRTSVVVRMNAPTTNRIIYGTPTGTNGVDVLYRSVVEYIMVRVVLVVYVVVVVTGVVLLYSIRTNRITG